MLKWPLGKGGRLIESGYNNSAAEVVLGRGKSALSVFAAED